MLSSNALRHDLSAGPSIYRGIVLFALYCFPVTLLVVFFKGKIVYGLCFIAFCVAGYVARLGSRKTFFFEISESGEIALHSPALAVVEGKIKHSSFYNGLFLFILIAHKNRLAEKSQKRSSRFVIFRDALSEEDYRLIARLMNHNN